MKSILFSQLKQSYLSKIGGKTMRDLLLLAVVAILFTGGWFLMKKLDLFLEMNCGMQDLESRPCEDNLIIHKSNTDFLSESIDIPTDMRYNVKGGMTVTWKSTGS